MAEQILSRLSAAGTAHSNSTDEAVLASVAIPANFLQAGQRLRVRGLARTTAQNSTDTLTCTLRFGTAALTGTAIFASSAIDQVAEDVFVFDVELSVRTGGSSGTLVAQGFAMGPDASGTAAQGVGKLLTSVDLTAAQYVALTADWSAASSSNSVQIEAFDVSVLSD